MKLLYQFEPSAPLDTGNQSSAIPGQIEEAEGVTREAQPQVGSQLSLQNASL